MAKSEAELEGIPYTTRGMGLRVGRRTKLMGVNGLGTGIPRAVEGEGLGQRTVVEVPDQCPECDSYMVRLAHEAGTLGVPRRVSCFMCGWDAFLVMPPEAQITTPLERERGFAVGSRVVVKVETAAVRPAQPVRRDGRKRPRVRRTPVPSTFQRNGGVQVFPYQP